MTTLVKLIGLTVLISFFITGCNNSTPIVKPSDTGNSLLWKIEKENHPTSYMFGTMHMIEKKYYNFSTTLERIIKSSDAVIMEVGGMPNPIQAMLLLKLEHGQLIDLFEPEELSELLDFFKNKLDISQSKFMMSYNGFKPFFLFQSITQGYFSNEAESYDLNIMQITKEEEIPLIGLETIKEQIGFFDMIPQKEMVSLIMDAIKSFEEDKIELVKLQELYQKEAVEELLPLMKEQSPEFMKYEAVFLTNRNKKWIPKLKLELQNKSCFIAVGAAHLFEENGIIEGLKNEGFKLTPVINS